MMCVCVAVVSAWQESDRIGWVMVREKDVKMAFEQ